MSVILLIFWNIFQIKNVARPKRYATLPAVKIGCLAVAHKAKKQGIGSNILSFIKVWFTDDNKTGCRFIIVDAYNNEETIHFTKKSFCISVKK